MSSPVFEAKYRGRCPDCGADIYPGDEVAWVEGQVCHLQCATGGNEKPAAVCPKCFQTKSKSGKCACYEE